MDILITIVITGLAVSYIVEFINVFTETIISSRILRQFLTLPLSVLGLYLLGVWDTTTYVAAPASALISATISLLINRPTVLRR
jgi:ABC-type maltose transport system permease subunit